MRKPRSRRGLSPSPTPSNGQGGRRTGEVLTVWGTLATLDLLFACFVANLTTQHIHPQRITSIQCEFLAVRNLKKGKILCHIKEKSRGCLWLSANNSTAVSRMAKLAGTWSFGSIRRRRSRLS